MANSPSNSPWQKSLEQTAVAERYAMIDDAMTAFPALPLNRLCMLFGISRSGYYARQTGNARQERDIALRDAIERLALTFPGYGYRRVTRHLQREGWDVNHKRVLRVMREESLLCQLKKRFVVTTNSLHSHRTYPNLLAHLALDHLNQAWVADLTYIRLPTAFVYLAAILDAYSRRGRPLGRAAGRSRGGSIPASP